ncbi:MAG: deacetylase [Clostridiales bacterium]|nr:deacetylase [Clostridiales bacterium]
MYFTVLDKKTIFKYLSLIVVGIVCSIIISGTGAYQAFYGYAVRQLPIYRVETQEKKIAISFDCAWGTDYTDKLLEIMQEHDVKCTFFTVEFWTKKYPEYIKKISDYGHEIGTHSSTHPYMSKLSKENIIKELSSSAGAIEEITGKKVELFRPPYGDYNDRLIQTAKELNLYVIQWDVDSLDWKDLSANSITERVISRVKNGSIVLFHNQGSHTAEALPTIITKLKEKGYEFVSIGNLIYRDNYKMGADGSQIQYS